MPGRGGEGPSTELSPCDTSIRDRPIFPIQLLLSASAQNSFSRSDLAAEVGASPGAILPPGEPGPRPGICGCHTGVLPASVGGAGGAAQPPQCLGRPHRVTYPDVRSMGSWVHAGGGDLS